MEQCIREAGKMTSAFILFRGKVRPASGIEGVERKIQLHPVCDAEHIPHIDLVFVNLVLVVALLSLIFE